jgi:hypothetical protein
MIQNRSTSKAVARVPYARRRMSPRQGLWLKVGENWTRLWDRRNLDTTINDEVRYQFHHRSEPGDAQLVNVIVDQMSRRIPR